MYNGSGNFNTYGDHRWIALLLGRCQLDVATCMAVYMDIVRGVNFATATANMSRKRRPSRLDQDRLTRVIEEVLERYNLDPSL